MTLAVVLAALLSAGSYAADAPRRRAVAPSSFPESAVAAIAATQTGLGVPGIAIAVAQDRQISFARGYGSMSLETGAEARSDSVFQIASLTKQMTAAAVMRLAELGKLKVGDPLENYISAFKGSGIRLDHLLNHTSGLPEYTAIVDSSSPVNADTLIDRIASLPREFDPGTRFTYRNTGYFILGRVIEIVSGRTYAAFVDQELFAPAGMTSTGVCGSRNDLAVPGGYYVISAKQRMPLPPVNMSVAYAAGSICSTATDLVRWNRALVAGQIVSGASYEAMTRPVTLPSGAVSMYGYGLITGVDRGNPIVSHGGVIDGFQSYLAYYPERGLTIVVLANGMSDTSWKPATEAGIELGKLFVPAK